MKKVSVVIPAHNKAELTVRTVESVLSQTYPSIEVIVVDDGSTDNTGERLSSFGNKIRYVYKENGGACSARNLGISLAIGEYIGLLDCDDIYCPEKIERSVAYLERDPEVGFVHTGVDFIDKKDNISPAYFPHKDRRMGWMAKRLLLNNLISNSTVVVRKSCFEKVGFFDETIFIPADWDMWMRLAEQHKVGYINTPLTLYNIADDYSINHLEQSKREQLIVLEKAFRRNPGLRPHFKNRSISNVYYRHGISHLFTADFDKAKEELTFAIKKWVFNLRALFPLAAIMLFGENLGSALRQLKPFWAIKRKFLNIFKR